MGTTPQIKMPEGEQPKKKYVHKKYTYRGVALEELLDKSGTELMEMLHARQRWRLQRQALRHRGDQARDDWSLPWGVLHLIHARQARPPRHWRHQLLPLHSSQVESETWLMVATAQHSDSKD